MELIYTTRSQGFEPGTHYRNPRFFDRPEHGATRVVVEGDYPSIASAYEAVGVAVKTPPRAPQPKPKAEPQPDPERAAEPPVEAAESDKPKRGRPRKSQE